MNRAGILHVPLALALGLIVMTGLGTHGILRLWRHQVETQYRLDRCVATVSRKLKELLLSIERDNRGIIAARTALVASLATPGLAAPARATLQALVAHQETLRAAWKLQQTTWLLRRGCDSRRGDRALPLGELPYVREPPDPLGPGPLRWTSDPAHRFLLQTGNGSRTANALIEGANRAPTHWKLRWTSLP